MIAAAKLTPEEFFALGEAGKGCDLVDGELEEHAMSKIANFVAARLFLRLGTYVESRGLGQAMVAETAFRCFPHEPDRVRKPDVSFLSTAKLQGETIDDDCAFEAVPDLVVEVISPSDNYYQVAAKREDWLGAGVKLYWEINPDLGSVDVYTPNGPQGAVRRTGTLSGEPVVPGFAVPVADLFPAA
jgi:Uma2 family endonuclease